MSKAVKTVVGVVSAVAIPFAAPVIASAIGTSLGISAATFGMSATVGSVLGSTAVGAALGGATQAVLGGDVGRGALMGAIGGGIGGYASAPSAPSQYSLGGGTTAGTAGGTTAGTAGTTGATTYPVTAQPVPVSYDVTAPATGLSGGMGGGGAGLTMPTTFGGTQTGLAGAGGTTGFTGVDYSLASGAQFPTTGLNPATAGVGLRAPDPGFFNAATQQSLAAGTPIDYSLAAGMPPSEGLRMVSVNPVTGGTQVTTGAGTFQSTTPISQYSGGSYVGPTGSATGGSIAAGTGTGATSTTEPTTFAEAVKQVPGEIAAKFNDPKALADLTLRAAGNLAGSVIAGDGLSDEERALLDAQTQELRTLQQTNAGLFAQRLEQAQNLIGESKYFDPEYFGLQRARRAQTAAARAKRAGLRGLEGASRAAEARRFDLATARDVGSSFDQGYLAGVQGRLSTMQAGINAMPQGYPSSMADYTNLRAAYGAANQRAREQASDIGNLFGSLTGRNAATGRD